MWLFCYAGLTRVTASALAQQVVRVKDGEDDLGVLIEAAADCGGDILARFLAQARHVFEHNRNPARRAHFARGGGDAQRDAELLMQ